jgi:isocitrate/isopropylmalate dehydrogenase
MSPAEYPDIPHDDVIVDAACMKLVLTPERFDVIVTMNLFGDIMSDLIAGLVGGLGVSPGANLGERAAIFEAVHGSAPDIAGQGIANPTALALAAELMLIHLGTARGSGATATRHPRRARRRPPAHQRPRRPSQHQDLHQRRLHSNRHPRLRGTFDG